MSEITPTAKGQAIQMNPAIASKYRFTKNIYGGPVFDFPAYGLRQVNLAELSEQMAARLVKKGYDGIERVPDEKPLPVTLAKAKE
jgi:hypothetical protein